MPSNSVAAVSRRFWGTTPDRRAVYAYDLTNRAGTRLTAITLGATITALQVADRTGVLDNVVLGMDDVDGYLTRSPYFGTVVGRYGNRIAGGHFTLDGTEYQLATNLAPNHLHGGVVGFDKHLYAARAVTQAGNVGVRFSLTSPDGDEGYPGEVRFSVRYLLGDDDTVTIDYQATTTRATPFNPTQHSYWNLAGSARADILGHDLIVHADRFTPVDRTLIPTGELSPVDGTPFDFRVATAIGARIGAPDAQLRFGDGYDHNYVLRPAQRRGTLSPAARLHDPVSGRVLEVLTSEPGMQLYSGSQLKPGLIGRAGRVYGPNAGVCLETQHFPDSPNHPQFPCTILRPESPFRSRTVWKLFAV
ncbi:MAG: aldose epimerase family protein [Gemmatimonadota bacterium]